MQSLSKRLPSPAMVVACIALTVALGGTAYASVGRNSVGTVHLKRNAVTSIKVRNNSLTGADINEGRLGRVPSAARALTAGAADTADNADQAARAPVSRLDYASAVVALPNGGPVATRGTVSCASGLSATGGGAKVSNTTSAFINDTAPVGKTGWEASGYSNTAGVTMTVYVICAEAATTTP